MKHIAFSFILTACYYAHVAATDGAARAAKLAWMAESRERKSEVQFAPEDGLFKFEKRMI